MNASAFSAISNLAQTSGETQKLSKHYHAIIYAVGAQSDRKLGIAGEDLRNSYAATEFVGWYNGHPDYQQYRFDLSGIKRVAVIGVGNVAMDVARILARTPEELYGTDIADYALETLKTSEVEEIYILGRRGPAQAAFTNPEIKELGEMADADIVVECEDASLDEMSATHLKKSRDRPPPSAMSRFYSLMSIAVCWASRAVSSCASWFHRSRSSARKKSKR